MTALETAICNNLCEALAVLSPFDRGRLLGYGEGLVDRQESDRRKAETSDNHQQREG